MEYSRCLWDNTGGSMRANPSIQVNALQPGMRIYVPLAFPLVSEEVAYTSILLAFIIEGLLFSFRASFAM